jgi:hypothetical protein
MACRGNVNYNILGSGGALKVAITGIYGCYVHNGYDDHDDDDGFKL